MKSAVSRELVGTRHSTLVPPRALLGEGLTRRSLSGKHAIVTAAGLMIAAVLIVAGGLLTWGHSFVTSEVHNQLAAQKIISRAKNRPEVTSLPKADAAAMSKYAGQMMTTGAQAEAWADHFIAVHLVKIGGGQTYSQQSGKALADPKNAALAAQVDAVFRGETLRGLLLNVYGYWEIGQIMLWSAFIAFAAGALMALFSVFGFTHLRRTAPEAEVLPKLATTHAPPPDGRGRVLLQASLRRVSTGPTDRIDLGPSRAFYPFSDALRGYSVIHAHRSHGPAMVFRLRVAARLE